MKKSFSVILLLAIAAFLVQANGQNSGFPVLSSQIVEIQTLGGTGGIAYTRNAVYRTTDNGATWSRVVLTMEPSRTIAQVHFDDNNSGRVLLSDISNTFLEIRETSDGGNSWRSIPIAIDPEALREAYLEDARLQTVSPVWRLTMPLQTSSNFKGEVVFVSSDGGQMWLEHSRTVELNTPAEPTSELVAGRWRLRTEGTCMGAKSGCIQETRLFRSGVDITPPQVTELAVIERQRAIQTVTPMFAAPGGNTRISLNRGFDKCQAGSVAQMQTWWNNSPHFDSNIYMSGRARACPSQPFTNNPAWIDQVTAMGWGLIPTVVGYQSPCITSTTYSGPRFSIDAVVAETQGRGEADIAAADAVSIGLTAGSIIYYDMERYDETVSTPGCRTASTAFLKGWTDRIKELGYKSGTYGSPRNAIDDWQFMPPASKMDAIWMARWDNIPSVWTYTSFPTFPTTEWANHQRIKQWQAPHNETWGGVTFNIDGNNSDGPVAGAAILKNRNADFDGDGKSDISVYRPSEGIWYVLSSIDLTFKGVGFGNSSDVIAPGDYDGDGKTDYCIFRPSDGVWHMLTKSGAYSARQFGASGDIPVPADYNGDGKADIAVFRPSNGVWYIANSDSQGTYTFIQFGQAGDKPVPGDYDGDGRKDMAVYRPTDGTWYIMRMSDLSFYGVGFGIATDLPAQGDYDGDGKTDQAVFRDGMWYLMQSTAGFGAVQFGQIGDIPAPGDFDGDGKSDVAIFRPSTGAWYTLRSTAGFWALAFGQNADRPVESAYLPQ